MNDIACNANIVDYFNNIVKTNENIFLLITITILFILFLVFKKIKNNKSLDLTPYKDDEDFINRYNIMQRYDYASIICLLLACVADIVLLYNIIPFSCLF